MSFGLDLFEDWLDAIATTVVPAPATPNRPSILLLVTIDDLYDLYCSCDYHLNPLLERVS